MFLPGKESVLRDRVFHPYSTIAGYALPVVGLGTEQGLVGISVPSEVVLYIAKRNSEGDHTEELRVCLEQVYK